MARARAAGPGRRALPLRRDQVSENIDQNARELWEDIGVETDEGAGADLAALQLLLPAKRPRH